MRGTRVRSLLLFLLVSVIVGPMIVGGSVVGAMVSRPGLFIGAIAGGLAGIALSVNAAARWQLIPTRRRFRTAIGGTVGFAAAAILASQPDWQSPIGPALSGVLVPLIALVGSYGGPRTADQGRT